MNRDSPVLSHPRRCLRVCFNTFNLPACLSHGSEKFTRTASNVEKTARARRLSTSPVTINESPFPPEIHPANKSIDPTSEGVSHRKR
jgi:hypothetical protein